MLKYLIVFTIVFVIKGNENQNYVEKITKVFKNLESKYLDKLKLSENKKELIKNKQEIIQKGLNEKINSKDKNNLIIYLNLAKNNRCINHDLKLLIIKQNKSKDDLKLIFKLIKEILIDNGDKFNLNKPYNELSWIIKEFLVQKVLNKKYNDLCHLDLVLKIFKKDKILVKYQNFFNVFIKDLYYHMIKKGFGMKDYKNNFLTLLNYLQKNKKFINFESSGTFYYNIDYSTYIPFLLNFLNYLPKNNLKRYFLIKTSDILNLIKLLIKQSNNYLTNKNESEKIKILKELEENLFIILLIKNKLKVLGDEFFPDIFYKLILKNPFLLKNIITDIDKNSENIFKNSFLNYNYYNEDIKNKIILYLKSNILKDIQMKILNASDSFYSKFNILQKKLSFKGITKIIDTYNEHFYFLKKIFNSNNIDNKTKNIHLKDIFKKVIDKINDDSSKEFVYNFSNLILHDYENILTKKFKKENNLNKAFIDVIVGESIINENIISLIINSDNKKIIKNIYNVYEKINVLKDTKIKNKLLNNFIKLSLISLTDDDNKQIKNEIIKFTKDNQNLVYMFLKNFSYYNGELEKYINIISKHKIKISKFNFKGIFNKNKLPKLKNKDQNYYLYELIGHDIILKLISNSLEIIKDFNNDCKHYIIQNLRENTIKQFINKNNNLNSDFKTFLNNIIENNIDIFIRKLSDEDQKSNLENCPISEKAKFDINNETNDSFFKSNGNKKSMSDIEVKTTKTKVISLDDFDFRV